MSDIGLLTSVGCKFPQELFKSIMLEPEVMYKIQKNFNYILFLQNGKPDIDF